MNEHLYEKLPEITPIHFFSVSTRFYSIEKKDAQQALFEKRYLLPSTAHLFQREPFAEVYAAYNESGLIFGVEATLSVIHSKYPEIQKGDSLEFMIDTRNNKTSGFTTKFCHHFYFLIEGSEVRNKGEKTHFRTQDKHDICNPADLICDTSFTKKGYRSFVFIPLQCLVGFDPYEFQEMGFTYRINSFEKGSQNFSASSKEFAIEQQPSLWSHITLTL